jgi:acetylornithine deacetylase/succinyl-diaminopimelate desuccinylase-like protein
VVPESDASERTRAEDNTESRLFNETAEPAHTDIANDAPTLFALSCEDSTMSTQTDQTGRVLEAVEANDAAAIDRLKQWLSIPSVGADSAFDAQTRQAADWAIDQLRSAGLDARLIETGTEGKQGHPIVYAHTPGADDYAGPHVLFYGHYDVQPPDPLDLWESAPFDPIIKGPDETCPAERIVARGACDDKGQVATFLESLRAWHETTGEPAGGIKLTVMIEGEEESGSANLERHIREHRDLYDPCDFCLVSDTGMLGRGKPAITYGLRGLTYTEVILHGPNQDLHSGLWGGRVVNPISELTKVLAQLWDAEYRVTVPGFYDDVRDITDEEREAWKQLGFDQTDALKKIGLSPEANVGEAGFTALEREWARPTAEINGIVGGYIGEGAKTVIPSHASAKISFRLVADQDPDAIRDAFFAWLEAHTPPGCRWELIDHSGGNPATVPTESAALSAAARALKAAGGVEPALIRSGGSIPVAGLLKAELGLDTVFMGFGLDDDRVHSPNEKFELPCFRLGVRSHALLIGELRESGA